MHTAAQMLDKPWLASAAFHYPVLQNVPGISFRHTELLSVVDGVTGDVFHSLFGGFSICIPWDGHTIRYLA